MAAAKCNSPAHINSNQPNQKPSPPRDQILILPDVVVPLPDSSPPPSPSSFRKRQENDDLNPIIQMMREQELGKLMLNIAVAVTAAVLLSAGKSKEFFVAHFVPFGLMTGFIFIWNGLLFRTASPRLANVFEQAGVVLVLLLLFGLVASSLPRYFSWFLWLCGCLSLFPLIVSMLSYLKQTSSEKLDN